MLSECPELGSLGYWHAQFVLSENHCVISGTMLTGQHVHAHDNWRRKAEYDVHLHRTGVIDFLSIMRAFVSLIPENYYFRSAP